MKRTIPGLIFVGWFLFVALPSAPATDWPTWRSDARRSAATEERLPDELYTQWERRLPELAPAWPNEPRLHFDGSYQPVVAGRTLFVGSPIDGSVTAFDTRNGSQRWHFYTEGPVRFAPVAWSGRVFVGSDDGFLYCLDAAEGKLLWRHRGAPADWPERHHLGNARLISHWPVRGGPVLVDDTVYFAAGIWPTMGVFVVALDAETGKPRWRNDQLDLIEGVRLDHNRLDSSGLSPQGYLVVEGDTLLVPNGRSMPAGLDRATGELLWYVQGYRNGDCRVTAMGHYALVGESGVVDLRTGREVGSRWAAAGPDAPDRFDGAKFDLFEGPIHPYKLFPGCDFRSVLADGIAYGLDKGTVYAHDLARASVSEYETEHGGHPLKPWRWDAPELWRLPTERASKNASGTAVIKAGNRLCAEVDQKLIVVKLPATGSEPPEIVGSVELGFGVSEMLAADGRLFVVGGDGRIVCLGGEKVDAVPVLVPKKSPEPNPALSKWAADLDIVPETSGSGGYCLVLGVRSGAMIEKSLADPDAKVIGVDPDADRINELRDYYVGRGLYGNRVELFVGDPARFSLPPYLARLIVSITPERLVRSEHFSVERLFETLRPYGGFACLVLPPKDQVAFEKQVAAAGLQHALIKLEGSFPILRRHGPPPDSAPWTHECADAARTFFSQDQRVKPPLGVLWYGDGPDHGFWKRKDYGVGVKPQVVGGRLFALRITTNTLVAYDVYTGRLLWTTEVAPFTRYTSMVDGIYVAGKDRLTVLDLATGKPAKEFRYETEPGETPFVSDIRVSEDLIVIASAPQKVRVIEEGLWDSTMLVALDRKTGKTLWRRTAEHRFNNNALAVGRGIVFAIDSVSAATGDQAQRRGDPDGPLPSTILALEARSGETLWSAVTENPHRTYQRGHWLGLRGNDDWLAYSEPADLLLVGKLGRAHAFEAGTGKKAWSEPIGGAPWILCGETFINQAGQVYHVRTGKPAEKRFTFTRGGCNYAVANDHLLMLRGRSASSVDTASGEQQSLFAVRSGCSNSLVAADGVLSVPNFAVGCVCNYPIQTSFAMVHMPEAAQWIDDTPVKPRLTGEMLRARPEGANP